MREENYLIYFNYQGFSSIKNNKGKRKHAQKYDFFYE